MRIVIITYSNSTRAVIANAKNNSDQILRTVRVILKPPMRVEFCRKKLFGRRVQTVSFSRIFETLSVERTDDDGTERKSVEDGGGRRGGRDARY